MKQNACLQLNVWVLNEEKTRRIHYEHEYEIVCTGSY